MPETKHFKLKLSLIGEQAVGKTSLIRRFVLRSFDEVYLRTFGFLVSKKSVTVDLPGGPVAVDLMISDLMGERVFLDLFGDAYFRGTQGVLAVFDVTRKETLSILPTWVAKMRETVGPLPVVVLGNKIDLATPRDTAEANGSEALRVLAPPIVLYTSAKTGENVEEAFLGLTRSILESELAKSPSTDAVKSAR